MKDSMKDDVKNLGYSSEEEFFYHRNQALIESRRGKLDSERATTAFEQAASAHWLQCPKCGSHMDELSQGGIRYEKCGRCGGVYFDRGEVETLLEAEGSRRFLEMALCPWKTKQ